MENKITVFENQEFGSVRTLTEGNEILFCGSDVAKALGYKVPKDAVSAHCKGAVKRRTLTNGGNQEMIFLHEGDVYRLIVHSKLPSAEKFERWVFDEVLPSVRKHGAYMTPETLYKAMSNPRAIAEILTALADEQDKNKRLTESNTLLSETIEAQRPAVEFCDHVTESKNSITMRDFAMLVQNSGIDLGRNKLFEKLRELGYLDFNNVPYQKYIKAGYFKVIESTYKHGKNKYTSSQTLVTGKGQKYLIGKLRFEYKLSDVVPEEAV